MPIVWQQCSARHFIGDKIGKHFKKCCHNGKVNLLDVGTPAFLKKLITSGNKLTEHHLDKLKL